MARWRYLVLGAGQQGLAAAYDLAIFGQAARVTVADTSLPLARAAVRRLKALLPRELKNNQTTLQAVQADGRRLTDLVRLVDGHQGVLSALPYFLNPTAARAAITARAHYVDLGGHFETTQDILRLNARAEKAGVTLTPDCGVAPGLNTMLAARGIELLKNPTEVRMYCGGLPQNPRLPLGYKLLFSLDGVLGNYFGKAYELQDGRVVTATSFEKREDQIFDPPLGRLESFVTGGATSTAPWTYEGKIRTYTYQTLRYPGHHNTVSDLKALGLLSPEPVKVDGHWVSPRRLFMTLANEKLKQPRERDCLALRVAVRSATREEGAVIFDVYEMDDPATGFTAMQRTTGFSAAVALEKIVTGTDVPRGAVPLEKVLAPGPYLDAVVSRGIKIHRREER